MKRDNIPGLEGYYISRLGILWSRYHKSGKLTQNEWHKVKPNHNQRGYLFVQKKGKCWYLHRLVAMAYIPNPNNYPIVRHLNDNPLDNRLANLAWGTQKDNVKDSIKNNSFHFLEHPSGPNHPNYNKPPHNKLSLRKERRVLRLYYKGLNIRDIQLRLRLKSSTSIRRILKNHSLLD